MLLASGEVAKAFGVTGKTVQRWEETGQLPKAGRIGTRGHRRWYAEDIAPLLLADGLRVPAEWDVPTEVAA